MADLFSNVTEIQWQMVVMWVIGGLLIWLAIKKEMEPTLSVSYTHLDVYKRQSKG